MSAGWEMKAGRQLFYTFQHGAWLTLGIGVLSGVGWLLDSPISGSLAAASAVIGSVILLTVLLGWHSGGRMPVIFGLFIWSFFNGLAVNHLLGWQGAQALSLTLLSGAALLLASRRWIAPVDPSKFLPRSAAPRPLKPVQFDSWTRVPAGRDPY